jgi:uncharacterized membrane protein
LGTLVPRWFRGEPAIYPYQYETRLLSTITGVGLLSAVLVVKSKSINSTRRVMLHHLLLGIAVAAMVTEMFIRL